MFFRQSTNLFCVLSVMALAAQSWVRPGGRNMTYLCQRLGFRLALGIMAALIISSSSLASFTVHSGWDILYTPAGRGTQFAGVPFEGNPLNTFNFGGTILPVGSYDTIVQRQANATVSAAGQSATIPIELVALHLKSSVLTNFGLGNGTYYLTLQKERGGPTSTGQMTINFENQMAGRFDSFFDVNFDVRLGSPTGQIALSDSLRLSSTGTQWIRIPPLPTIPDTGPLLFPGVNIRLNGIDQQDDFWPGIIRETHPSGAVHIVITSIPEPGSMTLLGGLSLVGIAWHRLRPKQRWLS